MPKINTDNTKKGLHKTDIIFLFFFCCVALFSWGLAPYGWAGSDEAFYIAEPYRFVQGDVFFVDDWNCGQLFAFLLIPLMKLHLSLAGSTDGIILAFRYYYVFASACVSLIIYLRGRKESKWAAFFSSMFLLLYSPLGVRNLSYNAMGLMSLSLACIIAFTTEKHAFFDMYLVGLLLAATVLCCPFTVALYIIYALSVYVICLLVRRTNSSHIKPYTAFTPRSFFAVTLGCATLFILFCVFVFSRASLQEVLHAFPYLFADPEHKPAALTRLIKNVVYCTITSSPIAKECVILCGLLALVALLDRKRFFHRNFYLLVAVSLCLIYALPYMKSNICNELMLPINIVGIAAFFLSKNRPNKIFFLVFVPGLIYAICMHHSSSLRYLALCNGFALCSIASAFFICNIIMELHTESKVKKNSFPLLVAIVLACLMLTQLCAEFHARSVNFFHDDSPNMLNTRIEIGVQRGLITSEKHAGEYILLYHDTENIRKADGKYVLYVGDTVWLPLGDSKLSANNSLWTNYDKPEASAKMLRQYLLAHPEKRPEYIYVTKTLTYTYQDDIDGMVIVDIINIENIPVEETETGYVIKMN